ncbi:MAG TPA: hypothetical protein VGF98_05495 [Candidatus Tumulicola sp.]|jgi:hypothetical protein
MKESRSRECLLGSLLVAGMLGGCSNGAGSEPPTPIAVQSAITGDQAKAGRFAGVQLGISSGQLESSMAKNVAKSELLYVSDWYSSVVRMYKYPSKTLIGTITGLERPAGMCVDKAQNVYIANSYPGNVLEYAHGGVSPIATFDIPNESPVGCAINPVNGDLAVGIISGATSKGQLVVFHNGKSTTYSEPNNWYVYFPGYDKKGNCLVQAEEPGEYYPPFTTAVDELPMGGSSLVSLIMKKLTISRAGAVMFDGKNFIVGDQQSESGAPVLYQATLSGRTLTGNGIATTLSGQYGIQVVQPFLKTGAKGVVGADVNNDVVDTWAYPVGGSPQPGKRVVLPSGWVPEGVVLSAGDQTR